MKIIQIYGKIETKGNQEESHIRKPVFETKLYKKISHNNLHYFLFVFQKSFILELNLM